jgi:DNA-binding LytR/AlgR family response regulator
MELKIRWRQHEIILVTVIAVAKLSITMSEAEALLPQLFFVRIHRSYIAAKKHISKLEKNSVWIQQTELPVCASYAGELAKITGSL